MRVLAQTVAENPDEEGLMQLMQLDIEHKHARTAWLAIERVLTRREPVEDSSGSYHVLPVAASEVRRKPGRFYCSSDGSERSGLIQGLAISFSAWQCGGHGNADDTDWRH